MASLAGDQEGGPRGQDHQRLLQAAQESYGCGGLNINHHLMSVFQFDPDTLFSEPIKYKKRYAYARLGPIER